MQERRRQQLARAGARAVRHADAANGFVLTNRGADITFNGPATLTLTQVQ